MNRQHLWKIAPVCLLLSSLAWFAHGQADVAETPAISAPSGATLGNTEFSDESRSATDPFDGLRDNSQTNATSLEATLDINTDKSIGGYTTLRNRFEKNNNLERLSHDLVQKTLHTNDKEEMKKLHHDLQGVVSDQFDLLQKARENQLAKLKKELHRLQTLHDQRQDQRERIVNDRVRSLLHEAEGLGWGNSLSRQSIQASFRNSTSHAAPSFQVTTSPDQLPRATPVPVKVESSLSAPLDSPDFEISSPEGRR